MARKRRSTQQRYRNLGARFRSEAGERVERDAVFVPSERDLLMYGYKLDPVQAWEAVGSPDADVGGDDQSIEASPVEPAAEDSDDEADD